MALVQSYGVWNNKGGVGKSTLVFHLSARYAELHPDQQVLVVDLCPQANASMMLLGGGNSGEQRVVNYCSQASPTTVVGYLSNVIAGGAGAPLPAPSNYLIQVSAQNAHIPPNLYLLCGDGNLEPMAPAINGAAAAPPLTPASNPWLWIHRIIQGLIANVASAQDQRWMVFVDTNPSFSVYTELAVSAVNRLITPVNADDSSRVATNAMFILLHGSNPPHPIYGTWTFAARAAQAGLAVPQIHLIVGNRLTQYAGAATAFQALSDATADTLFAAYRNHPNYFTTRARACATVQQFRDEYSQPLRDFNTAGVVAAHHGQLISHLQQGYYTVYGQRVKVNSERIVECRTAIDDILTRL